jgi:hypothetical protein
VIEGLSRRYADPGGQNRAHQQDFDITANRADLLYPSFTHRRQVEHGKRWFLNNVEPPDPGLRSDPVIIQRYWSQKENVITVTVGPPDIDPEDSEDD